MSETLEKLDKRIQTNQLRQTYCFQELSSSLASILKLWHSLCIRIIEIERFDHPVGAEPAKLLLGIGAYGRGFNLADPADNGFYAPATSGIDAAMYTNRQSSCFLRRPLKFKAMKTSPLLGPFCGSEFWRFSLLKI